MILQPWSMNVHADLQTFMKNTFIELFKKKLTIASWGGTDEKDVNMYAKDILKINVESSNLNFVDTSQFYLMNFGPDINAKNPHAKN